MIELTTHEIDGVRFYSYRILEPDDTCAGLPIHRISHSLLESSELRQFLKITGLKKVGRDYAYRADKYAISPYPYLLIRFLEGLLGVYWAILRWLYDNMRFFKTIPQGSDFSWKYFTPYVWYRSKKEIWGARSRPD